MPVLVSPPNLKTTAEAYRWGLVLQIIDPLDGWRWCEQVARRDDVSVPEFAVALDATRWGSRDELEAILEKVPGTCDRAGVARMIYCFQNSFLLESPERLPEVIEQWSLELFDADIVGEEARREMDFFRRRWLAIIQGNHDVQTTAALTDDLRENLLAFLAHAGSNDLKTYRKIQTRWARDEAEGDGWWRALTAKRSATAGFFPANAVLIVAVCIYLYRRESDVYILLMFGWGLGLLLKQLFRKRLL